MNKTQILIMNYLQNKVKNEETIPSLVDISNEIGIKYATLSDNLIKLARMERISYKGGKIIKVYTENYKGNVVQQVVEQHKNKYSIKEFEEKFDKACKDIILDYINAIDAVSFSNDNINKIIVNLTTITSKLKEKLFK